MWYSKTIIFQPHSVQSVLKESLNCIQFVLALYFKKLNSKTWRELILQLRGSRLSPGLPYLLANTMSDSFRFCNSTFGACEKHFLRDVRSSIFPHNQSFTKERKGERSRCRVILMNLWQGFFFFLPFIILLTAFLIPIKPILHSCLSFIELAGDIFSTGWPWETVLSKFHKFQEWSIQIFLNMRDT